MRPAFVPLLLLALAAAPTCAEAAARLQIPHGKHHRGRVEPTANAPAPPVSDVPEAIWSSSHTRR